MQISNSSFFSAYNSLYSSRNAAAANQSPFSASINNSLSKNSTNNHVANITLYKDAVLSTHSASGASAHVYYDELNDTYTVKGTDMDGKEYEAVVDVKTIDPANASRIEMIALSAYLSKQGDSSGGWFLLGSRREMDNYFSLPQNEQRQFKWNSLFAKENQYDDLEYIAQTFYKANAMSGYSEINKLIQNIIFQVKKF